MTLAAAPGNVAARPWALSPRALVLTGVGLPSGWSLDRAQHDVDRLGPLQVQPRTSPTRGLLVVLAGAGLLHLLGGIAGGQWLPLGVAALLALPVVALVLRPRLEGIEVTRELHDTGTVGGGVDTTLHVTNGGSWTTPCLQVLDQMPGHQVLRVAVPALRPGATASVRCSREVLARGRRLGGVVQLTGASPVGLLVAVRDVPLSGDVVALPAPAAPLVLPPFSTSGSSGSSHKRPVVGSGAEVLGLRPWRSGDAARAVSARASARHGRPLVLEREREQEPVLVVLVAGGGEGAAWEQLVSEAAALSVAAVRAGTPLVLLGPPGPDRPTPEQVPPAFAAADWAPPLDDDGVRRAVRAAGPGGRVVLLAPPDQTLARSAARRAFTAARCPLAVLGD